MPPAILLSCSCHMSKDPKNSLAIVDLYALEIYKILYVDTFTHLHIVLRSRQGKCCSPLSSLPGQGSTCPLDQVGDSHTSASTAVYRAHMLCCNLARGSIHTTAHLELKMGE